MERTVRLTGTPALVVLALIVGVTAWQLVAQSTMLGTDAAAQLKLELSSEYARLHLPKLQEAAQNPAGTSPEDVMRMVADIRPDNIEIVKIAARGHGDDLVVRAEVEVAGHTPPDGRRVRYFVMTHSLITGWSVEYPTSALSYYLAFL